MAVTAYTAPGEIVMVRLDIAAESQLLTVTRDESGQYHFRVVPRAEAREVTCTITVNAPGGAS